MGLKKTGQPGGINLNMKKGVNQYAIIKKVGCPDVLDGL